MLLLEPLRQAHFQLPTTALAQKSNSRAQCQWRSSRPRTNNNKDRLTQNTMITKHAKSTIFPLGLYWASMTVTLLLFIFLSRAATAFQLPTANHVRGRLAYARSNSITSKLFLASNDDAPKVAVKAADLDDALGLTSDERTVVNVHRVCSPSVLYVTSVRKPMSSNNRRRKAREDKEDENNAQQQRLPRGSNLGTGSGFLVDSDGYIVTNYHVIQRAYEANQAVINYETFWDGLAKNATNRAKSSLGGADAKVMDTVESFVNGTLNSLSGRDSLESSSSNLPAEVFVRFGANGDGDATSGSTSTASYHPCTIVDVIKELDVAVLKITKPPPSLKPLAFGSSSDLLVGQSLVAIGNPFGLDRTITSGLVSALGRSVTGVAGNDIKNCIQTDAAINPGNSGGPLLNLSGNVVGVNTMIISTSGSSAGIGFAVPGDNVKEGTSKIVDLDKQRQLRNAKRKGRGWLGVDVVMGYLEGSLQKRLGSNAVGEDGVGAFVTSVADESPLLQSQDEESTTSALQTTTMTDGAIRLGDRIVNVGGNSIQNGQEFASEMKKRVEGEQISLTVENVKGERRVLYATLGRIPL